MYSCTCLFKKKTVYISPFEMGFTSGDCILAGKQLQEVTNLGECLRCFSSGTGTHQNECILNIC